MKDVTITRIPVPAKILRGEWRGIVYAIDTTSESIESHDESVEESIGTNKNVNFCRTWGRRLEVEHGN